jgi:uncharacterized integral membrane protein
VGVADSTTSSHRPQSGRRLKGRRLTRLILAAAVLIYAVVFVVLNRSKVKIHFVFFTVTSRLWVGFLVCVALGALLGQVVGVYARKRHVKPDGRSTGGPAT